MKFLIPISKNQETENKRVCVVTNFNWDIDKEFILVKNDVSFCDENYTQIFESVPSVYKQLVVDNYDKINLENGQLIPKLEYNPEEHINTIGQYDYMFSLDLGTLKNTGMEINDSTTISELILELIKINIQDSDNRGKFNI